MCGGSDLFIGVYLFKFECWAIPIYSKNSTAAVTIYILAKIVCRLWKQSLREEGMKDVLGLLSPPRSYDLEGQPVTILGPEPTIVCKCVDVNSQRRAHNILERRSCEATRSRILARRLILFDTFINNN